MAQTGQYAAHQVGETNGISIIELAGSYDTELGGQANVAAREAVAQEFFRTHPDSFDFLVVIPNFPFQSGDGIAFHWPVRSSVQGIGIPPFDLGSSFGSPARMLGFIDLPALAQMETDPLQPDFAVTLNTLAHEILHQWGIHVLDASLNPNELIGQMQAHWSYLVDSSASVEYGSQWQDNGDGTFTALAVRRFYSPLDLYLAGFYDAGEVPPFVVIDSPGTDPTQLPLLGATVAGGSHTVSIQDIVSANGPRVPAAAQAQHAFSAAFVFLIRPGDTATPAELTAIDGVRREAMTHFAVLTGGRGTLDIASAALPPPAGSPSPVQGGPLRPTSASLSDALTWLRNQQSAAGSWQDTPSTQPRDSAVVYATLQTLDPLFTAAAQQLGLSWLAAQTGNNTDDLARLAAVLGAPAGGGAAGGAGGAGGGSAPLRARLVAQVNGDGGWGLAAGYGSDPLDTALAVTALAGPTGTPAPTLAAATAYLLANQVPGAGWGSVAGGASRTGPTALVLEALRAAGAATANPAAVATALAWLAGKQNPDGGFGDSPSTAHDTAAALLAAIDLGQGGAIRAGDAAGYLGTHQTTAGSWEGSTYTTASAVTALSRFALPNWAFAAPLTASPAQPGDGDRVAVTLAIASNGDVPTPAGVVRVYDGSPAAGGVPAAPDVAIPTLAPGQAATVTAVWDTLGKAGSHTLVAVIDPDNQVAELTKGDNQSTLAIVVAPAPAGVDLEVRGGDIAVSPPRPATLPVQLAFSVTVRNNGQTPVPAADIRLYLGTPPAATVLGDVTVAVPARSTAVANFVYTLAAPGTAVFTVAADPDNRIAESDKTNNSATVSVTPVATVDLGLGATDIQLAAPAFLGQDATFNVTFHNYGTVDAPQSAALAYTVTDGTTTRTLPGAGALLAAGGSAHETVTWKVDLTGSLTFTAQIQLLPEDANPANNQASLAFTSTAIQAADIAVGRGDLTVSPNPALEGKPLTATALVHNTGGQEVSNLAVAFYDGDPSQGAPPLGALQVIPDLAAGASATVAATEPSVTGAGNHLFFVVADPNNQQTLFSRSTLSTFLTVPVLSLPDAAVGSGSLQLQPPFPAPGQTVTLTATVANLGQQAIPNLLVRAYDGDPAQGGVAVGDATLALLAGMSAAPAVFTWTLAAGPGPRVLFVVADPDGAVQEATKANNEASLPITVQQGNFTVTNRYFSPNGDGVQDTTELDFRLSAPLTVAIQVADPTGKVVRTASGAAYANVSGGSFVWDGKDDLGRVVADADYQLQVVGADGTQQGQAAATVDTNRSPLLAALGTQFASLSNLTCQLPEIDGPLFYGQDEQEIFFLRSGIVADPIYGVGVYQMTPTGGGIQQIVPTSWFAAKPSQLIASADASLLAFDGATGQLPYGLWTVKSDGSAPPVPLATSGASLLAFTADDQAVLVTDQQSITALPLGGGAPRPVFTTAGDLLQGSLLSPDGQLLLAQSSDGTTVSTWIVNVATGASLPVVVGNGQVLGGSWSPDGEQLAVAVSDPAAPFGLVALVGRDGSLRATFPMPTDEPPVLDPGQFPLSSLRAGPGTPEWSWLGDSLAVDMGYVPVCPGLQRYLTIDLASGQVQTAGYSQGEPLPCLSYHVAVWDGSAWVERGVLHFDPRLGLRTLNLGYLRRGAKGPYRVRIRQIGGSAAEIDSVALYSGAVRQPPSAAHRIAGGEDVLAAVAARDRRVIDAHAAEIELTWQDVRPGWLRLALVASEGRAGGPAPPAASPNRQTGGRTAAAAPQAGMAVTTPDGPAVATQGGMTGTQGSPAVPTGGRVITKDAPKLPFLSAAMFWAPYQQALVLSDVEDGNGSFLLDLANGDAVAPILPQDTHLGIEGFSAAGRYMVFHFDEPPGACYAQLDHLWSLRSLMNLTADLQVRGSPDGPGYILEGTAADLHFLRYELEYAAVANGGSGGSGGSGGNTGSWTPIVPPSATPLIDSQFTTWVPPGPGLFLLRLTVYDLAGNSRSVVRQAASSVTPALGDVSLSPRYISPNGDGVQDTADIHYRVVQPVHVDFRFFDAAGNLVRTISADNAESGSYDLVWDGTGDDGLVVPDGDYTMKVLGYEFFITVDTTPPQLTLTVNPPEQCLPSAPDGRVAYAPSLQYTVSESTTTLALETGAGAAPATWLPAAAGPLAGVQYIGQSFRVRATDLAGNGAEISVPPGPEQFFALGFGATAAAGAGLVDVPVVGCPQPATVNLTSQQARFQLGEAVAAPLAQVFIDSQPYTAGPGGAVPPLDPAKWQAQPVSVFYPAGSLVSQAAIPRYRFDIDWALNAVTPGSNTAVRVRAVDAAGGVHVTQVLTLTLQGIAGPDVVQSLDGVPPAEQQLLAAQGLTPPKDAIVDAASSLAVPLASLTLVLTSSQDPRFNAPRSYEPVATDGTHFVFSSPDWESCTSYSGYLVATTEPVVDPRTGAVTALTLTTAPNPALKFGCVALDVKLAPVAAAPCGVAPATARVLSLTPHSLDGTALQLLTVTGLGGTLYSASNPRDETVYSYDFDTASLGPGTLNLVAHLSNVQGQQVEVPVAVAIEKTPPVAAITYPLSGQTVCGTDNVVSVQGSIQDPGGFSFTAGAVANGKAVAINGGQGFPAFQGDLLDVRNFQGSCTVDLVVTGTSGFQTCVSSSFSVDTAVESPAVAALPAAFSPNADGVLDTTTVTVSAGEPTHADLAVFPGALDPQSGACVAAAPAAVRHLAASLPVESPAAFVWDGKDDTGTTVADGLYAAGAAYRDDSCGNTASVFACVVVDNTPPQVGITYPGAADSLSLEVEVKGFATDANLQSWALQYGAGSAPLTWATLSTGAASVSDPTSLLGTWNTFGLTGQYVLRLVAGDAAGNTAETRVPINFGNRAQLITDLAASPALFSPNGDGNLDNTGLRFGLGTAASVTLSVVPAGGTSPVRTLLSASATAAGAAATTWDGTADGGARVADGTYNVVLAAAATANPNFTDSQAISVVVDTTPPTIVMTRPAAGGWVTPTGQVTGTIFDLHLASWSVALTATPQAPVWTTLASGTASVNGGALASLAGLAEGSYALKIDAADAAQNQVEQIIPFAIDSTPPVATLTAPAPGSFLGSVGGAVAVTGSVVELHPQSWQVQLGTGAQPASWTTLAAGASLPVPAPALLWNVAGVADGAYTLRLLAQDLAGQSGEARSGVTIDNTPPVVAITAPAGGATVTGPFNIVGTASDANLVTYQLSVAAGSSGQFSPLGSGAASISGGVLLAWNALPPDGPATLRLTAVDRAGNQSATQVQVTVHTHPPAAPQGLTAQVDQQAVQLSWLPNPETGIAGYRLYRNGVPVNRQALLTATSYTDGGLAAATYVYTVTAVDQAGLESAPSVPAQALVDLTTPTAILSRPRNGARAGGLVDILGTANKQNDFRAYRLYVTPTAEGSGGAPQLLRTSPLPVVADLLGQWNTVGLADETSYVLRLEAEDLSGNLGVATATVTVDNTPPAAPAGLTATPDGTTIHLAWNANTESDLAGYLLYRNGVLANAQGAVIGDLTPYILASPAFDDLALPDGTFQYVVYAVDQAGNESAASAPAQAALDNHPPHVVIVQPAAGALFQDTLDIVGTTADLDVASVQFQWQPAGAAGGAGTPGPPATTGWNNLGPALAAPPWEVIWDGTTVAYGDYLIRAVATDATGHTDPAPAAVPVTRKNLARPPVPASLVAVVTGGSVTLSWSAGTPPASDLAGYLVERTAADGTATQVTPSPIAATSYADAGLADGTYGYTVTAVNQAGNSSAPAGPAAAVVYTLALAQPYTPTSATTTLLGGTNAAAGAQVAGSVTAAGGGAGAAALPLAAVAADSAGNFVFPAVPLGRGDNQIGVAATDAAGNVSRTAAVPVFTADPPSQPTGLVAVPGSGLTADLSWNANPAAENVLGYRLLRDGNPAPDPAPVDTPVTASASTPAADPNDPNDPYGANGAAAAVDGDETTYWEPGTGNDLDFRNQWLEIDWPVVRLVTRVELDWAGEEEVGEAQNPGDFDLQGWDGRVWVTLAQVRGDSNAGSVVTLAQRYLTQKVRLHLVQTSAPAWLAEMRIYQHPLAAGTSATDTTTNGVHSYQVIAVGPQGLESLPGAAVSAGIGNVTPPAAVELAAAASGADVGLTWTASASGNAAGYLVFRDGAGIAQVSDPDTRAYTDAGRPNGIWHYSVEVVDALGNVSAPSNVVAVAVAVTPPGAPLGLTVTAVPAGGALDLAWGAAGAAAAGFAVERAAASGGPYQRVATAPSSPYRDGGLTNGQTYYYVVAAVDAAGNSGAVSNEASGTPADTLAPNPPVLTFPARSALAFSTADDGADLAGSAEPGSTVRVVAAAGAGGSHSTQALAAPVVAEAAGLGFFVAVPSPDGRYALLPPLAGNQSQLIDFAAAGGPAALALPAAAAAAQSLSWMADGRGLLLVTPAGSATSPAPGTAIVSYRFAGGARATLGTLDWVVGLAAAPDGSGVAVLGSYAGQAGLWRLDPVAGSWSLLAAIDPTQVTGGSLVWSPDGSYVAYEGPAPAGAGVGGGGVGSAGGGAGAGGGGGAGAGAAGLVVVQAAAPYAAALIEPAPGSGRPSFTPDGAAVAFTEVVPAGGEKVRLTTLASGATIDLTAVAGGPLLPQLSPDGQSLAYAGPAGLLVEPLAPFGSAGASAVLLSNLAGDTPQDVAWVPGGYLVVAAGDEFRIAPAGRFAVPAVALALGANTFTAAATDAAGNVSAASAPRVVQRLAANLPDLAIGAADLVLLPAAPLVGQAVRVSVTVHNLGPADAPATTLVLTAYGPGAAAVPLGAALAVPALAAGGTATVGQDGVLGGPAGPAGAWTLVAQVDPDNLIAEQREDNNQAQIAFQLVQQGPPTITVVTDRASYQPGDTVTATVTVWNGSAVFTGQAVAVIEDAQGAAVTTLPPIAVLDLGYAQQLTQQVTWNAGNTFAGAYQVDVKLLGGDGQSVAEATAPFAIASVAQLTAAVATDQSTYTTGAGVRITAQVGYPAGNAPLTGVAVHLQVLAGPPAGGTPPPAPAVLADWLLPLGTLLPGGSGTVSATWATGTAAAGPYLVSAAVLNGPQGAAPAATATTEISLTAAAAAVTGTLALADRAPSWGRPVVATYALRNGGAAALAQLPVRVRVLDAGSGQELARQAAAVDLAAGGSASGSASFDTSALGLGNRLAVLEADLPAAGGATETATLALLGFTVYDRTPPTVTVTQPAAGAVLAAAFQLVVTASDPLSPLAQVTATLDGGAPVTLSILDPAAGTYAAELSGVVAGPHSVTAQAVDAAGNSGASMPVAFTVAAAVTAPPVVAITGVQQGGLYNASVTPVVTVTAGTTYTATVTLDGQPFTSGTPVTAEGAHALAVAVIDAAGNQAGAAVSFAIDTTPPAITVSGVAASGLYNTTVTPVVAVTDAHPGTQAITLNGQPFVSGTAVSIEGTYALAVSATDAAGNQTSQSVAFTVQKSGPVITVSGVTNGGLYNTTVTPVVTVTDAHPGTQSITLNGQPFVSGTAVSAEGAYTLAVSATDAAGNTASVAVSFGLDKTPPAIAVSGVAAGGLYNTTVVPVVTVTDAHPGTQTVTLNGQPFVSGTAVSAPGSYLLAVTAVDAAGNESQAAVSFALGAAAPALSVADVTIASPLGDPLAAQFPVTLSAPAASPVSVVYSTAPGTAIDGTDYLPVGGTLTFAPGVTLLLIGVPVLPDPLLTTSATFTLQLAQPQGATLARGAATGTIVPPANCASPNLLANPGAEQPQVSNLLPGWDVAAGSGWLVASGTPPPFDGDDDFATGDAAGELRQDVDLALFASEIQAAGGQWFAFSGAVRTADAGGGAPPSTARIVVEYRDLANQTVLAAYDSGALASPAAWQQVGDQRQAPAGTRWIRVRLLSALPAGGGTAPPRAYFDGLSLVAVKAPALAVLDAAVASPAAGQQQPFQARVVLSCAASQTVTVHYATVDGTAVAGTDYQAASGTLVFSPGSVEQDVALVALGVAGDQVDRGLSLALTSPAGAGLARTPGQIRLLPRPFCAQPPPYWRHHAESWTVTTLALGGVGYDPAGALWLLRYGGADPLSLLAQQLVAVRLDLAAGGPAAGQTAAANADAFLVQHPLGTTLQGSDVQTAASLTAALAAYDSAGCPLVCSDLPFGAASHFNLFVLGNLTQSGTDTAGRLAAGGNVTLSSYSVGQSLSATGGADDVLIAGGALSFTGGTVSHGNVVYGGGVSLTSVNIPNGAARQDLPLDFGGASRSLGILSSYWAALAANGSTTVQPWKAIQLAGSNATLNVFAVHGSDLASASSFSIQVPAGSTALINVDGTSDQMQNFGFQLTGVTHGQVVYNFYQATTLKLSGIGVEGTVLAPLAAVNFSNGNVNGTLVGASVSGGGQFNQYLFTGCLPVGP